MGKKHKKHKKKKKEFIRSLTLFLLLVVFNKIIGLGFVGIIAFLIAFWFGSLHLPSFNLNERLISFFWLIWGYIQNISAFLTSKPLALHMFVLILSFSVLCVLAFRNLGYSLLQFSKLLYYILYFTSLIFVLASGVNLFVLLSKTPFPISYWELLIALLGLLLLTISWLSVFLVLSREWF